MPKPVAAILTTWHPRRVDIIAHRGASHDAPENTLASARLAWEQGADALELDVHLTRDGRLAVVHDDDLRRLAGVPRRVTESNWAEIASLDVGRWKGEAFRGEHIPLLEEVLATVPAGRRVFIEIKGGPETVAALTQAVTASALAPGAAMIISFAAAAVSAARRALPQHRACWILDAELVMDAAALEARIGQAVQLGLDGLDLSARWPLDADRIAQMHRRGLKVYVWTVDDPGLARRLAAAGLDGITTNRPGWLRAQLSDSFR